MHHWRSSTSILRKSFSYTLAAAFQRFVAFIFFVVFSNNPSLNRSHAQTRVDLVTKNDSIGVGGTRSALFEVTGRNGSAASLAFLDGVVSLLLDSAALAATTTPRPSTATTTTTTEDDDGTSVVAVSSARCQMAGSRVTLLAALLSVAIVLFVGVTSRRDVPFALVLCVAMLALCVGGVVSACDESVTLRATVSSKVTISAVRLDKQCQALVTITCNGLPCACQSGDGQDCLHGVDDPRACTELTAMPDVKRQLNARQTVVGTTSGVLKINDLGAAEYMVEIAVPPGTAGMQPSLALAYNSQQSTAESMLGVGWSLTGLSRVHRCPGREGNKYNRAISLTDSDALCLDGVPLLKLSINGSDIEYRTGAVSAAVDFTTIAWLETRTSDRFGNYYEVEYMLAPEYGDARPLRLRYTGNVGAGLLPYNEVKFNYTALPYAEIGFVAGQRLAQPVRLVGIDVLVSLKLVARYELAFREYNGDAYLEHIRRCGIDRQEMACLSPVSFNWTLPHTISSLTSNVIANVSLVSFSSVNYPSFSFVTTGDFNGDGLDNVVYPNPVGGRHTLMTSLGNGSFAKPVVFSPPLAAGSVFCDLVPGRFVNGSSGGDLLGIYGGTELKLHVVYKWNGTDLVVASQSTVRGWCADFVQGDFDGDSFGDLWNPVTSVIYRAVGDGSFEALDVMSTNSSLTLLQLITASHSFVVGDFDGNGLTDVLGANANSYQTRLAFGVAKGAMRNSATFKPVDFTIGLVNSYHMFIDSPPLC